MAGPEDLPPAGDRIAVLLVGRHGQLLARGGAFGELFGEQLTPRDERGQVLPSGEWPQALLRQGASFYGRFRLDLVDGGERLFDVSGYPLADGVRPAASGVLIVEEPHGPDPSGEVAGLVSHELRTPLTVLHAALQLMQRALREGHTGQAQRYVADALAETRQLDVLTGELLLAARLSTGQLRLRRERLALAPLTRRVCARVEALSRGPSIRLTAADDSLEVSADPARLEQMLTQLLANALVHASGTSHIDVTVRRGGAEAAVEVRDHGNGLRGRRLDRLAQPFYQAQRPDRPSRAGLGLGLFLCRELAQLHGGRLALSAPAGAAASATVWLPLA